MKHFTEKFLAFLPSIGIPSALAAGKHITSDGLGEQLSKRQTHDVRPLSIAGVTRGLGNQFRVHRRVARWTFPMWLYVSVTGVMVFYLLKAYAA